MSRDRDFYITVRGVECLVDYHIDSFGHDGNGWDDAGEAPEWHIQRIIDPAGNDVTSMAIVYDAAEKHLISNPNGNLFIEEEDYME